MRSTTDDDKRYSIGHVALQAGLSPHVIRAWERRYRAVAPARSPNNRRRYSLNDIRILKQLARARARGHRIGRTAGAYASLAEGVSAAKRAAGKPVMPSSGSYGPAARQMLAAAWEAVRQFDADALVFELTRGRTLLSWDGFLSGVVGPLMTQIGTAWSEGTARIAHEHFASNLVKKFLWEMMAEAAAGNSGPRIVVATPVGQHCEIGALMAALAAAHCRWRPTYLGPNLPAEEMAAAALGIRAKAVAVSIACREDAACVRSELRRLRRRLGDETLLLIGGRGAPRGRRQLEALKAYYGAGVEDLERILGRSV